jgi:hypothetical protein
MAAFIVLTISIYRLLDLRHLLDATRSHLGYSPQHLLPSASFLQPTSPARLQIRKAVLYTFIVTLKLICESIQKDLAIDGSTLLNRPLQFL